MKKEGLILTILLGFSLAISAQTENLQRIESINQKLYLIEDDGNYPINTSILTVQKKTEEQALPSDITPLRNSTTKYVDIVVPDSIDIREYAERLKKSGLFASVEFRGIGNFCLTPNDPYYYALWHIPAVGIDRAWNIATGSPGIKVAVIDSGIDGGHPDIGNGSDGYSNINTSVGWNYISNTNYTTPVYPHGTAMAGIIGAKTNNSVGVAGVSGGNHSSGITLIPYCVSNGANIDVTSYISDAIYHAVSQGAKVINMSFSGSYNTDIADAIQYAYNHGVTMVCATGNQGSSSISFPANHINTLAVGASNSNNQRLNVSNYGSGIDLVAPGADIVTTSLNNGYGITTGTSASTAIISGTIALMLSVNPCLTPSEIRNVLHNSCIKPNGYTYNSGGWNTEIGYGVIDVEAAVEAAKLAIIGPTIPCGEEDYYVANLPNGYHVVWSWESTTNAYCPIIQDSISNICTIVNNNRAYVKNALIASIYSGADFVTAVSKQINTGVNFTGIYSQDSITYNGVFYPGIPATPFCSGDTLLVYGEGTVTLYSTDFCNAVFSYEDHVPIERVNNQNGTITFSFIHKFSPFFGFRSLDILDPPYQFSTISTMTGKHTNNCETFRIHINCLPTPEVTMNNNLALDISSDGYSYTLSLKHSSNEQIIPLSQSGWKLEIADLFTGRKVISKIVTGTSITISTNTWKEGTYVVKATVANKTITKKITFDNF